MIAFIVIILLLVIAFAVAPEVMGVIIKGLFTLTVWLLIIGAVGFAIFMVAQ